MRRLSSQPNSTAVVAGGRTKPPGKNHKARERQKKIFTCDNISTMQYMNGVLKSDEIYNKYPNVNYGSFPSSLIPCAPGLINVGSAGNFRIGTLAVEKSFREKKLLLEKNGARSARISVFEHRIQFSTGAFTRISAETVACQITSQLLACQITSQLLYHERYRERNGRGSRDGGRVSDFKYNTSRNGREGSRDRYRNRDRSWSRSPIRHGNRRSSRSPVHPR